MNNFVMLVIIKIACQGLNFISGGRFANILGMKIHSKYNNSLITN